MNYPNFQEEKITHSIENAITGDSFPTEILPLAASDLMQTSKKNGWNFNWATEYKNPAKDVYKLINILKKNNYGIYQRTGRN